MHRRPLSSRSLFLLLSALLAGAVALRLLLGRGTLGLPDSPAIFALRAGHAGAAIVVGASLSVAGVLLQCLLRNPLASPDLMGLASGSGLAVMLAALLAQSSAVAIGISTSAAAFLGAAGTLALIYLLAQRHGRVNHVSLALIGVAIGFMFGSIGLVVQHLLADRGVSASRWLLGAIDDNASPFQIALGGALTLLATVFATRMGPLMDAATLSDDAAHSLGVPLARLRLGMFSLAGLLTAISVVLAGPIGFVGLICPHLVRSIIGPAHRPLLPAAALAGATLVVLADAAVRAIELGSGRLPLGVVTSIIGGPALIVLLRKRA